MHQRDLSRGIDLAARTLIAGGFILRRGLAGLGAALGDADPGRAQQAATLRAQVPIWPALEQLGIFLFETSLAWA